MSQKDYAKPIEYHTTLNPKLWDHDRLKGEVRGALLRIAEDFKKFCGIDFDVLDVIITGGNVNYSYTTHSDVDLHLVVDFKTVACDREVAELFDTKRLLYKKNYTLEIHGIPVELYVEDNDHPAVSAGSYSILDDQWLTKPQSNQPEYDREELKSKIDMWHKIIRQATKTGSLQVCRKALNLLRAYRKQGLKTPAGEFSIPNLVYKSLRNDHTLKGITILIDRLHDQELSI